MPYTFKYNTVRPRSYWARKPRFSKVSFLSKVSPMRVLPLQKYRSVKAAATAIGKLARGYLARKKMKWTARRAVGKARLAQAKWRRAYFQKHGRAI